ncbi:TATA box-binding protein-associated factor RNA polymerase I subunit C isoform X2 [Mastacembelus armatus]|uniref:TATA-box binding protein associated factor, RNA polymerase I subunit C n=1 Tax=Mastacembelus armatus TaxID=205130 RepID=A0A3Q3NDA1_9TELE|nr:TATA box-binding protein-associated factor RNA polymerase I subunit C isoform X2 [Mastacembelus armatus]
MDHQFPQQLFPSFYNCGPPDSVLKHCAANWGCYSRLRPEGSGPLSSWTFTSKHKVRGEAWHHTEPLPVPLLSPKSSFFCHSTPPDPLDFTEHMWNFYMDHSQDAFGCMSEILGKYFDFNRGARERSHSDSVHMWKVKNILDILKFKMCPQSYSSRSLDAYSTLLSDAVHSIPPELLGALLHEELMEQRASLLFSEAATGGALSFIPFSQSSSSSSQLGCLLYPSNQGLHRLNFHKVGLQHHHAGSFLDATSSNPFSLQLKGPIRQISSTSLFNDCCVAVRSDRLCGVWRFSERNEPRLLQVVNTKELATCVNVSPHVLGEVLVASESGAANLWTVGKGMQKVRVEDSNLYFNAKSAWRWCEFSAHPRVMVYADRTGVELTDIRVSPVCAHTLFRISNTSECRRGERLILSKYVGDVHSFHHLITTQYSAYIMDERFPGVPMLKWDHMMQSPPMFCHVIRGSTPGSAVGGTAKVLLGSHSSQEITMLQYSGGRAEACSSQGPAQALLRPKDSLKHLPVQIPHRLDTITNRLSSPAAGLTCIQKKRGREAGGEECLCIIQLSEAGDIFYQILEPEQPDTSTSQRLTSEDPSLPPRAHSPVPQSQLCGGQIAEQCPLDSQLVVSDTSSDEGVLGPTQSPTAQWVVAETPKREQHISNMFSGSFSEDSESEWRRRNSKNSLLHIVVDDPELGQVSGLDTEVKDGKRSRDKTNDTKEPGGVEETMCSSSSLSHIAPSQCQTLVKLSKGTHITWKHWLQKLMKKSREKEPHPRCLQHFNIQTKSLLHLPDGTGGDLTEDQHVQSIRQNLRACMFRRSLLVHSTVSTSLSEPDVVPVPNPVDTEVWQDELSQRLTLSWQGEEAWRAWWDDHLGLNRDKKVEALKRKRRREKESKRAAGQRLELSGSFTSSLSYQSELDDFSDSTGWSSATSQGMWLDTNGVGPLSQLENFLEHGTPRATTPSTMQNDMPDSTPIATPQSVKDKLGVQQTPSSSSTNTVSQLLKQDSTPTGQRRNRRPAKDYLSSLFEPQDESSQHNYFQEEESSVHPQPAASSSQLHSFQSFSQRSNRVDLSQETSVWSRFSLSPSQSSLGQRGLSQASQASQPKKKSRMGF